MKRFMAFCLLVIATGFSIPGFAQQQLFMLDLGGTPLGRAGLKYEHMILRRFSAGAYADGYFLQYTGASLSPFVRFYAGEFTAPESFFVHLQLTAGTFNGPLSFRHYRNAEADFVTYKKDEAFSAAGYGIGVGRQWMLTHKVAVELSGGFQYMVRMTDHEIMLENVEYPGLYRLNGLETDVPVDNWYITGPGGLIYIRIAIGLGWW